MAGSERTLHLISGDPTWCHAQATQLKDELVQQRLSVLSNDSHYRQVLGQEFDCVIYDCFSGLDADALGALSGTIRGGGALILLTPPLAAWHRFNDPDYRRHGYHHDEQPQGLFIQRLLQQLSAHTSVIKHNQDDTANRTIRISLTPQPTTQGTADQTLTIAAIERVACGHAKRPLVIKADRGRGKSAAIGLAAASLLNNGKRNIVITAPAFAAVETLFKHAAAQLPDFHMQAQTLIHSDGRRLTFMAPDKLMHEQLRCDLLCVDEAAAIPSALLEKMLKQQNRILFATTVHGYEGSGRGFDIRFSKILDRLTPQWHSISLTTPIRWQSSDALETLLNDLLLFDTEQQPLTQQQQDVNPALTIQAVTQPQLFANETLLREFFGLLVSAHYRTRPFDLRHLLDGKQLRLWQASINGKLVGALVCVEEGKIDEALAQSIVSGARRPKNQLIPQTLQQHLGVAQALSPRYLRIMRIAVTPDQQRHAIATKLLQAAAIDCSANTDLLATSFGATTELLDFWHSVRFTPVRIGLTRDAASGCHSVVMLSALSNRGNILMQACLQRYRETLPYLLRGNLSELETAIIRRICSYQQHTLAIDSLQRLALFASNALPMDAVLADLQQLTEQLLVHIDKIHIRPDQQQCLILFAVQEINSRDVATRMELNGKLAAEKLLRQATVTALEALYGQRHLNESDSDTPCELPVTGETHQA